MDKTGTTTLQNSVFSRHSEVCYLGKAVQYRKEGVRRGFTNNKVAAALEPLLLQRKRRNRQTEKYTIQTLAELSEKKTSAKILLASWESIANCRPARFARLLEQLQLINSNLHVLFTIRNPIDWIASAYVEKLKGTVFRQSERLAMPLTLNSLSRWYHISRHAWRSDLPLAYTNIRTAQQALPSGRVGVVCFEHLRQSPTAFYEQIADFLGISLTEVLAHSHNAHRNPTLTSAQFHFLVTLLDANSGALGLSIKKAAPTDRAEFKSLQNHGETLKIEIPDVVRRRIESAASKECKWLADKFDLPLERLGYPV